MSITPGIDVSHWQGRIAGDAVCPAAATREAVPDRLIGPGGLPSRPRRDITKGPPARR
jgi:hypothetical protein